MQSLPCCRQNCILLVGKKQASCILEHDTLVKFSPYLFSLLYCLDKEKVVFNCIACVFSIFPLDDLNTSPFSSVFLNNDVSHTFPLNYKAVLTCIDAEA